MENGHGFNHYPSLQYLLYGYIEQLLIQILNELAVIQNQTLEIRMWASMS